MAISLITQDETFLKTKYHFTRRKIKFSDCVLDLATGQARPGFLSEEKFIVHVESPMPPRVPADIDAARSFVQDIFTLPGQTAPRSDDYDFNTMPLWQFVSLAIGTAIAGDVNRKLMYTVIVQRNSGKGMLVTAIGVAFGGLFDARKSANNLLGTTSDNDEAKKNHVDDQGRHLRCAPCLDERDQDALSQRRDIH